MAGTLDLQRRINELRGEIAELRAALSDIPVRLAAGGGGARIPGTFANPKPLGDDDPHNETADTETWDITNQGSNDGAVAWITTAIVYNEAGDQILYEFRRPFTWDSDGRLVSIGAETRITTETPELGCT